MTSKSTENILQCFQSWYSFLFIMCSTFLPSWYYIVHIHVLEYSRYPMPFIKWELMYCSVYFHKRFLHKVGRFFISTTTASACDLLNNSLSMPTAWDPFVMIIIPYIKCTNVHCAVFYLWKAVRSDWLAFNWWDEHLRCVGLVTQIKPLYIFIGEYTIFYINVLFLCI